MSEPVSFAEHTCWNEEDFRHSRKPVVFRLYNVGSGLGRLLNVEFTADYGLWYDQEDKVVLWHLQQAEPEINWNRFVFHRDWMRQSTIDICCPEQDAVVARMEVRGLTERLPTSDREHLGDNVVRMADFKAHRMSNTAHSPADDVLILELSDVVRKPDNSAD